MTRRFNQPAATAVAPLLSVESLRVVVTGTGKPTSSTRSRSRCALVK